MRRPFVVLFLVVLLVIAAILLLTGGGDEKKSPTADSFVKALPDYAITNATVSLTQDGSVNGDDAHRAIRITIGRLQRQLDIIQGYSGKVINSYQFYNSEEAYAVFLRAIDYAGFLTAKKNYKLTDERGLCPLGTRFIYVLEDRGDEISRLWAASCEKMGSSNGSKSMLLSLFKAQITDYSKLTSGVDL